MPPPPTEHKAESLRHGSVRYVLEVAPSMLRESDVVSDILIERIRSQEDSEEAVNAILRLMSLHLQSNAHITEQLVELLFTSDYRLCIIHHLPKLTYQSKECTAMVLHAYRDLLESDSTLVVPIMGSLADMPLAPDQQNAVVDMTHTLMPSIDEADIPVVVRGMLALITPSNGAALIGSIREQCRELSTHTLLLVVEVMGPFLRQGSTSLKYILRAIRSTDALAPIDGIWLVLLHVQDPTAAWHTLTRIGRKVTQSWLEATADLAIQASLVHQFLPFCLLVVQSGFAKATLASLRPHLVLSGVRTVAYVMAHTPPGSSLQHDVLVTLLTLTTQSHKFSTSTKQEDLRSHVPRAAAICIADAAAAFLPPSCGHIILDSIYTLSAANDTAFTPVVDTLCFALVQLVARDPTALYALVLLTIQKHILVNDTTFQVTAMLLASHLSYARQLDPLDGRAITAWMHRLVHTAPLQVTPFICAYLSVHQDDPAPAQPTPSPGESRKSTGFALLLPALVRRGVLILRSSNAPRVHVDRFVAAHASDSGDVKTDALYALLDMVHCLVVHAMRAAATDDDRAAALEALLFQDPHDVSDDEAGHAVGTQQCLLMVAIGVCNGLHAHMASNAPDSPLFSLLTTQFQAAYDMATALDMTVILVVLSHRVVLDLTHVVPNPAVHVLHLMLHHRHAHTPTPSSPKLSTHHHHWQLYGTYTNLHDDVTMYLGHLPHWMSLALTYGHHEHQPTNAETLVQLYAILRQLLLDHPSHADAILAALASAVNSTAAPSCPRTTTFDLLHEQATEQLQDAQAIVHLIDLQVAVAGASTSLRRHTARLAHSVAKHVFPDAALDLATWRPYIARPIAASTTQSSHLSLELLPSMNPLSSETYYLHHAVVTAYSLHPSPTVFLKEILDALNDMTETPATDLCHPTYRSLTRHTFRLLVTTHWQCLVHHLPTHVLGQIGATPENPFVAVIMGFALVTDSFAMVRRAIRASVDAALAQKTIGLLLKACQVVCEQMVKGVDRCLKWRQSTAVDDPAGDVRHLSPALLQMDLALAEMDQYVVEMRQLAVDQWKAAAKPTKSKLQKLVANQSKQTDGPDRSPLPAGQVKFIPQVLRWIQRTQLSLAKTQKQYSIPVGSDLDLIEMVQWPRGGYDWSTAAPDHAAMHDRWRRMQDAYQDDEEEKEEAEEEEGGSGHEDGEDADGHAGLDGFYASMSRSTTVRALQTPQKAKSASDLHDNDAWGFPSIVVDFKTTKRRTPQPPDGL